MRRSRKSRGSLFSFWPPFVDILFTIILFFLFYILVEFFANSEIFVLIDLRKRQNVILTSFKMNFKREFASKVIQVRPEGDLQRFRFSDRILFDSGRSKLKESGKELLAKVFVLLQSHQHHFARVQVIGHTDNIPLKGSQQDNWSLSANRSVAVVRYAVKKGFAVKKLSATGYGEHQPIALNTTEKGRRLNRRIEILIVYKRREKFIHLENK